MSPMVRQPFTMEHALLGFLREEPEHGYAIYQRLSDPAGLGLVWRIKQSQLYSLLSKLEEAGYASATIEPQGSRPPRKVYSLTRSGRQAFQEWLHSPVQHGRHLRLEFLAKFYFARRESQNVAAELIDRQRHTCRQWLEQQQNRARETRDRPYDWLVHQFRIGQIKAMLQWLDVCADIDDESARDRANGA